MFFGKCVQLKHSHNTHVDASNLTIKNTENSFYNNKKSIYTILTINHDLKSIKNQHSTWLIDLL